MQRATSQNFAFHQTVHRCQMNYNFTSSSSQLTYKWIAKVLQPQLLTKAMLPRGQTRVFDVLQLRLEYALLYISDVHEKIIYMYYPELFHV